MKAHEGWRVAKPKARKWDSKDKGGKDKQKVRKYMKVWNEWQEQIQLPLLLENATLSRRSSLIIASNLCLHKGFQNLQHQTAPEIPEIVFFDSASWHRSWHQSWMVDVRCKDHEVRCRRCLATLIVQKGCDRIEEFRTVKEIS